MIKLIPSLLFIVMHIQDFCLANRCQDPESLDINTMLLDTKRHLTLQNVPSSYIEKRSHVKKFDVSCPGNLEILRGGKPRASICPTYREIDVDVNRIPKKIVQRRCKCTNCLPIFDNSMGSRSFSRCVPTFQYQMVLRRVGCNNGVYEYKPVMEPFVVGCSCQVFFKQ